MSFQGFAREEGFSTYQTTIDIGSVIDNDLAEANRMSKFMSKNTQMEEKWGNMYLNALIKKHEVEKRNREENFQFFMDNRKEIQKQIRYNNEIKFQDSQIEEPAPLSETIVPILWDFAVKAGSKVIQNAMAKKQAEKDKLKKQEQDNVRGANERLHAEGSEWQKKNHETYWKKYEDWNAEERKQKIEYWNSQGNHQVGTLSAGYQHKISGMAQFDKVTTRFSDRNLTIGYQKHYETFVSTHENGAQISTAQLAGGTYSSATAAVHNEQARAAFYEKGLLNEGNSYVKSRFAAAARRVESQVSKQTYNNTVRNAVQDEKIALTSAWEREKQTGGIAHAMKWATDPNNAASPAGLRGPGEGWKFVKDLFKNGGVNSNEMREAFRIRLGPHGISIEEDIRKGNSRGREFSKFLADQVKREQGEHVNQQNEITLAHSNLMAQLSTWDPNNPQHQQESRHMLEAMSIPGTQLHQAATTGWSQQQHKDVKILLGQIAGVIPQVDVRDQAWKIQESVFSKTYVKEHIESEALKSAELQKVTTNNLSKMDMNKPRAAFRQWLRYEVQQSGLTHPEDVMRHINRIIGDTSTKGYQRLQRMFTVRTQDDKGTPLKKPFFPYLEHDAAIYSPKATGVSEYKDLVAKSYGNVNPEDIYQGTTTGAAMVPLLNRLNNAQKQGFTPQQIQHILTNHGVPYITARLKQGGLSVGGIVNEAIEHGDYDGKYEKLSDDVIITKNEMEYLEQSIPQISKMPLALQSQLSQGPGLGWTPNAATNNISSGFASNRNIVPVPGTNITMNEPSANVLNGVIALGDELGINMRGAFTSGHRDNAKQQSLLDRWHAGDPDIVYKPAQPGNHPHGYGDTFDAGFTDKEKGVLKEYERRNPGIKFIQPVDGDWVHYQIIGTPQRQITPQQVIPVPSGIGLTPWTAEDNTPALSKQKEQELMSAFMNVPRGES